MRTYTCLLLSWTAIRGCLTTQIEPKRAKIGPPAVDFSQIPPAFRAARIFYSTHLCVDVGFFFCGTWGWCAEPYCRLRENGWRQKINPWGGVTKAGFWWLC